MGRIFRVPDDCVEGRFDHLSRVPKNVCVEAALKGDFIPIVAAHLARRGLRLGDQTKEKSFDPCAFLREQCWIGTEAAEVGDLAGKQFGMRTVRHVGRL